MLATRPHTPKCACSYGEQNEHVGRASPEIARPVRCGQQTACEPQNNDPLGFSTRATASADRIHLKADQECREDLFLLGSLSGYVPLLVRRHPTPCQLIQKWLSAFTHRGLTSAPEGGTAFGRPRSDSIVPVVLPSWLQISSSAVCGGCITHAHVSAPVSSYRVRAST